MLAYNLTAETMMAGALKGIAGELTPAGSNAPAS